MTTKKYLVTYLVDGIKKAVEVNAKNEYDARTQFYNYVNFSPSYIDHAIISVVTWEEYGYITSLFNA